MTEPRAVDVDQLDADIWTAWLDVLEARKRWARCPSSENNEAHDAAETTLNKLLEFRHAAHPWLHRDGMPVPGTDGRTMMGRLNGYLLAVLVVLAAVVLFVVLTG